MRVQSAGGTGGGDIVDREVAKIPSQPNFELRLLGRFDLVGTKSEDLGIASQRLAALVAIRGGAIMRWQAAQVLYPEAGNDHAAANLRAVLWRLHRRCPAILEASSTEIRLTAGVTVDYWAAMSDALQLMAGSADLTPAKIPALSPERFANDLLPGWSDSWLISDRERFHQLRLHALEDLCRLLTRLGLHGAAVDAGLAAVAADSLRETAQRSLIDAYLAEGNTCDAIRQFEAFRALLRAELGLQPSDALRRRVAVTSAPALSRTRGQRKPVGPG